MPSTIANLAHLVANNDKNLDPMYVSDLLQGAPFLRALTAKIASNGTLHKYLKTTAAAGAGFRDIGVGRDHSTFTQTLVTMTLYLLDASFHVDKAYADNYKAGMQACMEMHGMEALKAAFALAEAQLINGTAKDAGGYLGLRQCTAIDAVADTMVVNAGSAAANATTSVYAVVTGETDVALVAGTNPAGEILSVGEMITQMMPDSNGKFYPAYVSPIMAYLGLQVGGAFSIGRIANIGAAANKLTDALLAQLLAKFPVDKTPSMFVMNRQSLFQLQASRTATSATGQPAPIPAEAFNVPIVVSEGVVTNEPVLT